jgi:hypothetical protein
MCEERRGLLVMLANDAHSVYSRCEKLDYTAVMRTRLELL